MNSVIRIEPFSPDQQQAAGWNTHLFKTLLKVECSVQCIILIYPKGFGQALFWEKEAFNMPLWLNVVGAF